MIGNFNMEAQNILLNAKKEMNELGHPYIGTEHLLLSILKSDSDISNRLNSYNLNYNNFKEELCKIVGTTDKKSEYFLYTPLLRKVIENAIIDSKENNDGEVTSEHLFFAMLEEGEGIAIRILIGMGIDIESMYDDFSSSLIKKTKKGKKKKLMIYDLGFDMTSNAKEGLVDPVIGRDKEVKRVMEILCRRTKNNPILIGEAGVGKTAIVEELSRLIANDEVPNNLIGKKVISLDMATMVAGTKYRGEFEERMKKVIKELEDNDDIILFIDEIHTLVGAGGAEGAIDASNILKPALARGKIRCIGATTIEEYKKFIEKDSALERRFQKIYIKEPSIEETINILNNLKPIYEVISLDMATMVAGTKYRGEFEERMKKVIKELEDNDDIILFIDEIHTLVGAGGAEGAIDASNILKPALARGKIRCIGATTIEEYKKFIEKDSALERRFQKIYIKEPSIEETINILNNLKPIYEKYHNVIVPDSIINSIVSLSEKYIFDRNRPDKEIDILDEVCSMVSMKDNQDIINKKNIKKKIEILEEEKNSYIIDNNIDKAYDIRKKETELLSILNELELSSVKDKNEITIEDVAFVINSRTNTPIYEVMEDSSRSINNIKNNLKRKIIGQDKAIDSLIEMTKRIKFGYNDRVYSSLFVGPTGVGKSALAKWYANNIVGESNFIRLDMSEFGDSTSVNKILGSSPGYVGYDDNKNILEEVRNKPNSVILLDEIDKAHPSVINLFYQILEDGKIKNSKGIDVRFNNSVIIMTSNIGFEKNSIGFNKINESTLSTLKNYFSVSFINRIDNVIAFNRLSEDNIRDIINIKLDDINNKYKSINISFTDNLINDIVSESKYNEFGARRLDKIIGSKVENKIIDAIMNKDNDVVIDSIKENITS